jgi:hypothetical protein
MFSGEEMANDSGRAIAKIAGAGPIQFSGVIRHRFLNAPPRSNDLQFDRPVRAAIAYAFA